MLKKIINEATETSRDNTASVVSNVINGIEPSKEDVLCN